MTKIESIEVLRQANVFIATNISNEPTGVPLLAASPHPVR
jgi:hypothetical protein